MVSKYVRGMIYWVNLPNTYGDSVQTGRRPCIIVSNNIGNVFSENITIVPCTTQIDKKTDQPTHHLIKIFSQNESLVLAENVITISKKLCDGFIGILDENNMKEVDKILKIALDLGDTPIVMHTNVENVVENDSSTPNLKEDTDNRQGISLRTIDAQKRFLDEFEKYGVDYVLVKYKIDSRSAAYQRKQYYKNKLTNILK